MSIKNYIFEKDPRWSEWKKFYQGERQVYNGLIFHESVYNHALRILEGNNAKDWMVNSNPLLQRTDVQNMMREYITAHHLQHTFFSDEDIIKNPSLIKDFCLDINNYKNVLSNPKFVSNYIQKNLDDNNSFNEDIVSKMPFHLVWPVLDKNKWHPHSNGVMSILKTFLRHKKFDTDVKPVLMQGLTSSRDTWSTRVAQVMNEFGAVHKKIVKEPVLMEKIFSQSDLVYNLMGNGIIPEYYLDKYHHVFVKHIHSLDLYHMRSYNPDRVPLFFKHVLKKPNIHTTAKQAAKLPDANQYVVVYEEKNYSAAFRLSELSALDKMLLYLQCETSGLEAMVWVAGDERPDQRVLKKNGKWHYEIGYLRELKNELDADLSVLLKQDVAEWLSVKKMQGFIIVQ